MSLIEALRLYERAEGKPIATNDALAALSRALMPMLQQGAPVDDSWQSWPDFKDAVGAALGPLDEDAGEDAIAEALLSVYQDHAVHMHRLARPRLLARTDWGAEPPPAREWIVPAWIPAGRVSMLTGEGGRGKSRLALMLAAALASGQREWTNGLEIGLDLIGAPVVMASWEDDRNEILRRLHDWPLVEQTDNARDALSNLLGDRLAFHDMAEIGALWEPSGNRHTSNLGALTEAGRRLREDCETRKARLLIIDPLAAAFALNENDRALVRGFMADWNGWARRANCAVLIVAHPSRAHSDWSGSTDWQAASRAMLSMTVPDKDNPDNRVQLASIKSSYAKKPAPLHLYGWKWWSAQPWEDASADDPLGIHDV